MLKESRGNKYQEKVEKVIQKVKRRGFEDIKASIDSYESPVKIISTSGDLAFVPDVTAKKYGNKAYFEISKRGGDAEQLASKWKLLSVLAELKRGVFKIFVPHGSMQHTLRIVNKHNIQAELIKI